jgi:signal transduction histidine kinase
MQPYSLRYRWRRPDNGNWIWLETYGDIRRLDDGRLRIYGVAADVTLRQEAEEALQRALTIREELLGLVSHELRTPLTTLNGNISVLKRRRDTLDPSTLIDVIADLESDAQRLQRIVENMLTLARTDLDATEEFEPLVLGRVIAAEIADHGRRVPVPPVSFAQPPAALVVLGNEMQVRQVVGNLLSNAVKYGKGSDTINVTLAQDGPNAVVSVEDHGMGLSEEARASVFEAFFRSAEASTTAAGVGLGLTVCQRLVELHGGRIWVDSEPGRTVFSFTIPLVDEAE